MLSVVNADGTTESGFRAHLVALVRSGARFENGALVERTQEAIAA